MRGRTDLFKWMVLSSGMASVIRRGADVRPQRSVALLAAVRRSGAPTRLRRGGPPWRSSGTVVWVDDSRTLIPIDQPDELAAHLDVFLANHTF